MVRSKEIGVKIKAINLAKMVEKRKSPIDRAEHRLVLAGTGMDEQMVESTLDAWEMEPKGLMWYHSREWLRRIEKELLTSTA